MARKTNSVIKVVIYEYESLGSFSNDENDKRRIEFEAKINLFLSIGHEIKQILQSSGGGYNNDDRPAYRRLQMKTVITIFYLEK